MVIVKVIVILKKLNIKCMTFMQQYQKKKKMQKAMKNVEVYIQPINI